MTEFNIVFYLLRFNKSIFLRIPQDIWCITFIWWTWSCSISIILSRLSQNLYYKKSLRRGSWFLYLVCSELIIRRASTRPLSQMHSADCDSREVFAKHSWNYGIGGSPHSLSQSSVATLHNKENLVKGKNEQSFLEGQKKVKRAKRKKNLLVADIQIEWYSWCNV